jgi:hypothetical protein
MPSQKVVVTLVTALSSAFPCPVHGWSSSIPPTLLGGLLPLHFVGELPRDDGLDGGNRHFLADSSFVEPAFESRSDMQVLPVMTTPLSFIVARSPNRPASFSAFSLPKQWRFLVWTTT